MEILIQATYCFRLSLKYPIISGYYAYIFILNPSQDINTQALLMHWI